MASNQPKPVRPYSRFPPTKIVNTGKDPMGSYAAFIKNDPYKNLDWKRDHHELTKNETAVKIPHG